MSSETERFTILSGCSGGGKSTLLAALSERGYATIEEPGRRIVAEELACEGRALPWVNLRAFAHRAIEVALQDREDAKALSGRVFFDRGLIDAVAALVAETGDDAAWNICTKNPYGSLVFLTPPWPEIFVQDKERQHNLSAAIAEYERLCHAYDHLGYRTVILPKASVEQRVDFIFKHLPP